MGLEPTHLTVQDFLTTMVFTTSRLKEFVVWTISSPTTLRLGGTAFSLYGWNIIPYASVLAVKHSPIFCSSLILFLISRSM
jgi:hypothetical protein